MTARLFLQTCAPTLSGVPKLMFALNPDTPGPEIETQVEGLLKLTAPVVRLVRTSAIVLGPPARGARQIPQEKRPKLPETQAQTEESQMNNHECSEQICLTQGHLLRADSKLHKLWLYLPKEHRSPIVRLRARLNRMLLDLQQLRSELKLGDIHPYPAESDEQQEKPETGQQEEEW